MGCFNYNPLILEIVIIKLRRELIVEDDPNNYPANGETRY